ncbi:hypothetical protein BH11PLA1_BH11PLA1_21170 [soil metagenome]
MSGRFRVEISSPTSAAFTHFRRIRKHLPERIGTPCRILINSRGPGPRNLLIEFPDGAQVVTARWNIRRGVQC